MKFKMKIYKVKMKLKKKIKIKVKIPCLKLLKFLMMKLSTWFMMDNMKKDLLKSDMKFNYL